MNTMDPDTDKRIAAWPRVLGWMLAVIAVSSVFVAWLDPDLMVAVGNAVRSCF